MMELLFAMALAVQRPERTLQLAEVKQADPMVLAPKMLPPETSEQITGGWVRRYWAPGQMYQALFWEKSLPERDGICARRVHLVSAGNPTAPGNPDNPETVLTVSDLGSGVQYGPSYPEPATEARCAELTGYIGASQGQVDNQLAALDRLTETMRLAAGTADLPFALECDPQESATACNDPRRALAELPLDKLLRVQPSRPLPPRNASTPPGPRLFVQTDAPKNWNAAEVEFDTSGPGARSWIVTLTGDERVETVRLRSAMIIRH
ncbi:hypothetical protein [Brevundimonas fontaquae]|uniref:Uncharacterized protein n=1 Tax=Brevundimonas fontaquae TaxID=2813778 RepID=A0ABX7LQE6_9CAUL|nr:hypothetical protein [Brevundimonas fontaquae]QSF54992.1 hypothetical protein JX001_04055 [Brevundimonas fontaquae]